MGCLSSPPSDQDQACEHRATRSCRTPQQDDSLRMHCCKCYCLRLTLHPVEPEVRGLPILILGSAEHIHTRLWWEFIPLGLFLGRQLWPAAMSGRGHSGMPLARWHSMCCLRLMSIRTTPKLLATWCYPFPLLRKEESGLQIMMEMSPGRLMAKSVQGNVHAFNKGGILFDPRLPHATERWEGDRAFLLPFCLGRWDSWKLRTGLL